MRPSIPDLIARARTDPGELTLDDVHRLRREHSRRPTADLAVAVAAVEACIDRLLTETKDHP